MVVMNKRRCLLSALVAQCSQTSLALLPPRQQQQHQRPTATRTGLTIVVGFDMRLNAQASSSPQSSSSSPSLGNSSNQLEASPIRFSSRSFTSRTPGGRGTPSWMGSSSTFQQHESISGSSVNGHHQQQSQQEQQFGSTFPSFQVSNSQALARTARSLQLRPKMKKQKEAGAGQRNYNKAMGDVAFLRKRTTNLLSLTKTMLEGEDGTVASDANGFVTATGGMKVGRKSFHFLMDAWAFSGELDAPDQALALLRRMEELWDATQQPNMQPDVRSYTKVMNAWSRSMREDAGIVTRQLLAHMSSVRGVAPNSHTYAAVVEAYANSDSEGAAQACEELCESMVQKYLENRIKRANGECVSEEEDVRPTARCFNAAISAYGKIGEAHQAEYLFDRMEELYWKHSPDLLDLKPSVFNYNSLITAWANCAEPNSAARAEDVLVRLQHDPDCAPTTVSYNAVINAYAKAGDAPQAEAVLKQMNDHSNGDIQPNTRSFNTVINAWAKSGDIDAAGRAEDLLDHMKNLAKEGNSAVRPDAHSFCTVINAWARSQKPGKAERANNMFREMTELYEGGNDSVRPNVVAVNAVMNACAHTSDRHGVKDQSRALEIAHMRLKELEKSSYGSPDQITYGTFLKVCANQMPDCDTRRQLIRVLFHKCSQEGQVGNMVLNELKYMGPPELYEQLIGSPIHEDVKMEDLPVKWWCNVVECKGRRRRNN